MKSRILHLADLHLGDGHEYLGAASAARRREADGLLRRIADWVLSPASGVGGVLIAGDLFDRHDPPEALVESVLEDLSRLASAGIQVLTVPGNHDEYSYPAGVYRRNGQRWPGLLVTTPAPGPVDQWILEGQAVDLYAMAFVAGRSRGPFDEFSVAPSPARKVAVLHGSLDVNWTDRSLPLRSKALALLGLDYLALGHVHQPMDRPLGNGWACYPGRIEGGGFDDPGGAGLVTVDLAAPELKPRRDEFPCRKIADLRWNLSGLATEDELDGRIARAVDPDRILRIRLEGIPGFALRLDPLLRKWKDRFFHLEIIPPQETSSALLPEELVKERTIRGAFARVAAARIEEAEADSTQRAVLEAAFRHGLAAFNGAEGSSRDIAAGRHDGSAGSGARPGAAEASSGDVAAGRHDGTVGGGARPGAAEASSGGSAAGAAPGNDPVDGSR